MSLEAKMVVGLGELLWDCFGEERRPGGAPANVAYHARLLGAQGVVCSRVGVDNAGIELLHFLTSHGLDTRHVQRDDAHPTGHVTVHMNAGHGPAYTIHEGVAWDHLAWTPAWAELARDAAAVCFGTLAQRAPESRATIHAFLDAAPQALRVYDINLRPPHFARTWIEASLERAHVLKLNDEEWPQLNELLEVRATDPLGFSRAMLARFDLTHVFITRGGEGCLAVTGTSVVEEAGVATEVADTVGAGDAFSAALIVGLLSGWPLGEVAHCANRVGALVASYPGAMPQVAEAMAAIRADYGGNSGCATSN